MPTRIVLSDKASTAPVLTPRLGKRRGIGILGEPSQEFRNDHNNNGTLENDGTNIEDGGEVNSRLSHTSTTDGDGPGAQRRIGSSSARHQRSIVGFRSSILRELEVRSNDDDDEEQQQKVRVSSEDIRASPRLLGYMFCMIAAAVMLVSVVQFYRLETVELVPVDDSQEAQDYVDKYYGTVGGLVYKWKLWASLYMSAAGVGLCLLTVLAHFDTICFPRVWVNVFRDGSLAERNWIFFLILFWAAAIHAGTSSLSVGEYQANVFFTTWIAFSSIALNYGVWRESAGYRSLAAIVMSQNRETTYNWLWTGLFSIIFAGATTDLYYNRNEVQLRLRGETLDLTHKDWVTILCVVWAEALLCMLAVLFNEVLDRYSCRCRPFWSRHEQNGAMCVCGWRQLEGLLILISIGGKFYIILAFTGVDGVINGLSNAYYGIWLSFFNSVFCLGTWLRENRNIEYFVREDTSNHNEES